MIDITYINNGLYKIYDSTISGAEFESKIEKCFDLYYKHCSVIDWCLGRINIESGEYEKFYQGGFGGDWENFRLEFLEISEELDLYPNPEGVDIELLIKVEEN